MASSLTGHPELDRAIERSSSRYGIPPDIMVGIWRVESASSFPNPYRNSLGYGGLFGTSDWDGSTQSQADLSASILANLLRRNGGDISSALSQYSGGGYTSVPGQVTFGNVKAPSQVPQAPNPLDGSAYQAPARPGGSQDASFGGELLQGLGDAAGNLTLGPLGPLFSAIGGAGKTVDAVKGFFQFLMILFDPRNWLRAFEAFTGLVMILLGLYYFGKEDGSADLDVRTLLRSPRRLGSGALSGGRRAAERGASGSLLGRGARRAAKAAR